MKRYGGKQALEQLISRQIRPVQRKRGFAQGRILSEWTRIVGPVLAARCVPQKLSFPKGEHGATLHVLCESGWALELQFQQEVVCEKIAAYFGYRAVGRLRIHQGILPARAPSRARVPPPPDGETRAALDAQLAEVGDETLRRALLRLGLSRKAAENPEETLEKGALMDDR